MASQRANHGMTPKRIIRTLINAAIGIGIAVGGYAMIVAELYPDPFSFIEAYFVAFCRLLGVCILFVGVSVVFMSDKLSE